MDNITITLLERLQEIAKSVFDTIAIKPGQYTASELVRNENKNWNFHEKEETEEEYNAKETFLNEIEVIEIDTFKCRFPRSIVFSILNDTEKIFCVPASKRASFIREDPGEELISMVVTFPKGAKNLSKFVGADSCRELFTYTFLDVNNSYIVATDTLKFQASHVIIEDYIELIPEEVSKMNLRDKLYISPKYINAITGQRCKVSLNKVEKNGETIYQTIVKVDGKSLTTKIPAQKYPNWKMIMPDCYEISHITFTDESVKRFKKFVQKDKEHEKKSWMTPVIITFEVNAGESTVTVKCTKDKELLKEATFNLIAPAKMQLRFGLKANTLYSCLFDWTGSMWISPKGIITLDSKYNDTRICMLHQIDHTILPELSDCKNPINWKDRFITQSQEEAPKEDNIIEVPAVSYESNTIEASQECCSISQKEIEESTSYIIELDPQLKSLCSMTGDPTLYMIRRLITTGVNGNELGIIASNIHFPISREIDEMLFNAVNNVSLTRGKTELYGCYSGDKKQVCATVDNLILHLRKWLDRMCIPPTEFNANIAYLKECTINSIELASDPEMSNCNNSAGDAVNLASNEVSSKSDINYHVGKETTAEAKISPPISPCDDPPYKWRNKLKLSEISP